MAPLQALAAVPAALVMAAAVVGAGSRLRLWLRVPVQPGLRLPVDWSLGSLVIAAAVLLLGLLGLWSAWTLGAVVAAGIGTGRWRRAGHRWSTVVPGALGGMVALPVALAAPFFYDALVYHLGLPWQALVERGLRPHPEDLFSSFPPLAQLLYAPALALGFDRAPALLHWGSFVAAGCAVGALARVLGAPRWAAALAAAALLLLPGHALVPGLPAAEGWAIAAILAALAIALSPRLHPGGAALAGLLVGAATAARLQGIPWAVIVLGAVWLRERGWRPVLAGTAGWLAGTAPWWVKNLLLLGDPAAPLFWRREGMATLWRDAGSLLPGAGARGFARSLVIALAPHFAYLLALALAAALTLVARRAGRHWLAGAVAVAGVLAWAATGSLPRFLAPTLGVLLALAAAAARTPFSRWAAALALAGATATGLVFNLDELRRVGGLAVVVRSAVGDSTWVANNPLPAFACACTLPTDARVLFVGEPRGFGFPRRFVAPSQHDVSPLRTILEESYSAMEACARMREAGFTHVLVNRGELSRLARSYPVAPFREAVGFRRWNAFLTACGPPVVDTGGVAIFTLPVQKRPGV